MPFPLISSDNNPRDAILAAPMCASCRGDQADRPPFLPSPDDPVTPSDPNTIPSIPYRDIPAHVSPRRPARRLSSTKSERSANLLKINFRLSTETHSPIADLRLREHPSPRSENCYRTWRGMAVLWLLFGLLKPGATEFTITIIQLRYK